MPRDIELADALTYHYHSWRHYWCLLHPKECFKLDPEQVDVEWPPIPPLPDPPFSLQQIISGSAIHTLLNAVGYIGPDQEGGPDPNGPLGPYIRDALVGLSSIQLAAALSDPDQRREVQGAVSRVLRDRIEKLASEIG